LSPSEEGVGGGEHSLNLWQVIEKLKEAGFGCVIEEIDLKIEERHPLAPASGG